MLIAALMQHAGAQVARRLKGAGPSPDSPGGAAFQALKSSIASGSKAGVKGALNDIHKLLASAGSVHAATSVENRMSGVGGGLKTGGSQIRKS